MDVKAFSDSIDLIAHEKGISHESIVAALKEAMESSYIKYLKGGDDAVVEAVIDEENGHITLCQKKEIVKEVLDDYLEISKEDALEDVEKTIARVEREIDFLKRPRGAEKEEREELKYLLTLLKDEKKNIKVGNSYSMYCPLTELTKLTALSIKSILKTKINEAERVALYDIYKDHIGEMMTGVVERFDEKGATIKMGRATVELSRKNMIGDELFKVGDNVKVYIQEVKEQLKEGQVSKGPQIEVTRASEGFLKRLFEDEIHEIYEGVVLIKGIARSAGIRSKVAVSSTKEDIDPTGACIGQGGSRIQKVVAQLGNSRDKEKIDVIPWSSDPALYVAESLRPAQVIGVALKEPEEGETQPGAIVVVKDEQYYVALGKKNANIRLAKRLTGYQIELYEETAAIQDGIEFETIETLRARAEEEKSKLAKSNFAARSLRIAEEQEALRRAEEEVKEPVLPEMSVEDEELLNAPLEIEEEAPIVAAMPVSKKKPATILDDVEEAPAPAPVEEEAPVEEAPVEIKVEVKTTTTLEDLEKGLVSTKGKKDEKKGKFKKDDKKPRKITEKEVAHETKETPVNVMPIYTEEELAEVMEDEAIEDYYNEEDENLEYEYNDEYYDE